MRINSIPPKELYGAYMCTRNVQLNPQAVKLGVDNAEISPSAKTFSATLKTVKKELLKPDEARSERLKQLKSQIEQQTYFVPADKIAEKMLDL
ncbi:MAG: Anti-sigma-28 factor, FlgM [Firmicutes bacterium ADurb.Bin356]|nr:MAG: Anti-sigma-28 factor, FlgM [Firmicutes bacterium ADurb.Bin356]